MNKETKEIHSWEELSTCTSDTHILDVNLNEESGWIRSKVGEADYYLSTHSFYASQAEASSKILQDCGFPVHLATWG